MKVYVLTEEPYHDNSTVLGVYASLTAAELSRPDAKWRGREDNDPRDYNQPPPPVVAWAEYMGDDWGLFVWEFEVLP